MNAKQIEHGDYHKDGSIRSKGQRVDGKLTGYREWFRKDGTKMRSGYFENREHVGEWITYDKNADIYKITVKKLP